MIIDFHNDTILKIFYYNLPFYEGHKDLEIDFNKLSKVNIDAMFFAFCTSPVYSRENSVALLQDLRKCLDDKIIGDKAFFEIAKDENDLVNISKNKKHAVFLSIEGAYSVEKPEDVDELYDMGFRLITLTHTRSTNWAGSDSTTDGLSKNGAEIIRRMNKLGIIIDLAHTSAQTIRDVTKLTKTPVVVTHCGVKALNKSSRALDDDSLQRIVDTGGIIGVSFFPEHLRLTPPEVVVSYEKRSAILSALMSDTKQTERQKAKQYLDICYKACKQPKDLPGIEAVFNTIDYLVSKFDASKVSIGSDFDGIPYACKDFDNISKLTQLTTLMQKNGYPKNSIDKIMGENIRAIIKTIL